jgi:1-acyl-sn-glycerol-3-phosphate acyltransferase
MPQKELQPHINTAQKITKALLITPFALFLLMSLLFTNALQMLSVLLLPFSKRAFRSFNRFCANRWWGLCVLTAQTLYKSRIKLTGDDVPVAENAIVVANHQQMPDITFLFFLAWSKKRLGDLKWMVKDIIKYVPGVGWGMLFLDCIFVKRDWRSDRVSIEQSYSKFLKENIPIWQVSFVEGTRITEKKLQDSNRYAQSKGIKTLKHLLHPRTKGFCASVEGLRSHIKAVYDITIAYPDGVPSLGQYILGLARVAHLHVRRYEIQQLPQDETCLTNWIQERFQEKDRLLAYFYQHGHFLEESKPPS